MVSKLDVKYLSGLDLLRLTLSVSILVVHFPHFDFPFRELSHDLSIAGLPFGGVLGFLYKYGGFAVEIFWMISGIIFYRFYLEKIADKKISLVRFIFLRLTRLYPLHFVTLISVAFLQYYYVISFSETFIYSNNDKIHFIMNIIMINFWNAKFGLSFNGPFWSVSVELFVYVFFFLLASGGALGKQKNLVITCLFFFACYSLGILSPFYECLLYFFAGCLIVNSFSELRLFQILLTVLAFCGMLILKIQFGDILGFEINRAVNCFLQLIIATWIILIFMYCFSTVGERVNFYLRAGGNMTYAIYMIHISIQIVLILFFYDHGRAFFFNRLFFSCYILGTCILGYAFFELFEKRCQNYLRKTFRIK